VKLAKGLCDNPSKAIQSRNGKIRRRENKIAELRETNIKLNALIVQLRSELKELQCERERIWSQIGVRLKLDADINKRLEVQVERFEQLMSKVFRKERQKALSDEIERLNHEV
jgi:predicted RNase H-like nuclease (RuvC/YqgF family)